MNNCSDSERNRFNAAEWSRLRQDFLLFFIAAAGVWIILYGIYYAFPLVQNGAEVIAAKKVDILTSQPVFTAEAKIRVLAFGNSKILAGFNPAVFGATVSSGVETYNAARPARDDYVILLKHILARGTRPTHVLVQGLPADEQEGSWRDYFLHDKLLIRLLFPFRTLPRDVALFLFSARSGGGIVNSYRENVRTVDQVIADRGYYFIKGQSHYAGDRLPDDYHLPIDNPKRSLVRTINESAPAFKELADLSAKYRFKVIFIPTPWRTGEVAPPDPSTMTKIEAYSQVPNFFIAGPPQWVFEPRYFSDPVHLNREGAELYSRRLAELTAAVIKTTD